MVAVIAQVVGSFGIVVSLLVLAWQTKRLGDQTRIANATARYVALHNANATYHKALDMMFRTPGLRAYFYEQKPCPDGDPNRERALAVAEIVADSIDHGIRVSKMFPDHTHKMGWHSSALFACSQPIILEIIRKFPEVFPDLVEYVESVPGGNSFQ